MRREINLKPTLSFLLPTAIMLLLVACGDTQPLPDIDATVEATVELANTSEVTPTTFPLPIYTPPPPAAPEVVVKEVIVEKLVEIVVEKEVVKEIIVEKIVEVVVTPTPTPTPTGTLAAHPWVDPYNSLIINIDITLGATAKVFVEYENPKAGRFRSRTSEYANTSHQLSLVRLRPLTTYSYEVFIVDENGVGSSSSQGTFRTGPLPVGLRHFATIARGESTYPLTLKEHNDGDFMGMVALDSQANVVWYYESPNGEVRAIGQKSNGNLIYVANLTGLREITPLGEEVNRLNETCMTSEAQGQIHHEVVIQPDSRVLYLSSAIHVRKRPKPQTSDTIGEWNQKNGTSRILFDLFDFLPFTDRTSASNASDDFSWKGCHGAPVDVQDWTHSNSLFVGTRGNVIMSIRHLDQIISIAPDFQSIEWRLGGPRSDFIFPNSGDQFYHQHSAVELANGNILLFDNGNSRPDAEGGEYSRALELHLDLDDMSARKVWQYRHEPDLFAACCSNVTRLGNGNTVLVFGGDFAREDCCRVFTLIEAAPSGEKVFEIQMRSQQMPFQYRVYPISSINGETQLID